MATAKDQTADSDAMFKWRVLQVALIVSPFMGLSVMGPITHIFQGVFMNAGGIGNGIASLATGQYTGPFGDFCELLHLDDAIRWLLCDMPGLSDVVNILNTVVSSHLVQGVLGGVVLPLASSPLVPIAIAGVFSLFRANAEIDYSKKYGDAFKNHEKAMREVTAPDGTVQKKVCKAIDEHGNIFDKGLMSFLADNRDSVFYDKVRYFRALERELGEVELEQAIKRFQDAPKFGSWKQRLIDSELELQKEEYTLKLADNCGVDTSELPQIHQPRVFAESTDANKQARMDELERVEKSKQVRSEALAKVEAKIKKKEVEFFKESPYCDSEIKQNLAPLTSTTPKSSSHFAPVAGKTITA